MAALLAPAIVANPAGASAAKISPLTTPPSIPSCPRPGLFVRFGKRPQRSGLRAYSPSSSVSSSSVLSANERSAEVEQQAEEKEEKFDWFSNWYPVAPVCDLDKKAPHAKKVMGLDVVVWWDRAEGKWQVFDDRCPHRLAPLSEGRIDPNGRLQCVYHGWCFDGSGSCKYIPQAPQDGPPVHTSRRACAFVYPSFEQNGLVWFWPSTDPQYKDIGEKLKPPLLPKVDDPSYSSLIASRDIPYGYEVLIENLMDPAHVPYAHYGIMRTARKPPDFVQRDREGGRPLDITVKTLDAAGFVATQENGYSKFVAPCLFYAFASFGSNAKPDPEVAEDTSDQKNVVLIFICVPVAPGRSRLIWTFPRNFALWTDKIVPRWIFHIGQNLILDSDLYLLHLEERKIEDAGQSNWQKACFVPTKSDALVIAFRKWLRKYSNGQIEWATQFGGLPPTFAREQLMDRYYSHVVNCSSCRAAVTALKALEFCLQVLPIALIGMVAVANGTTVSSVARKVLVFTAVLCFVASKWLGNFIYKTFYFHDYNHAFK
ncbi:protochlorophyllide-dependent translocon component 52, chloroplastic isoform X2 [Nymphaea colorata]|uniref:protochlorophyllide-dependent translocon component 52, chloroplastic isoform X2 n=1 Tax=Nymphaea colorata TaxID=210225 RepID=UPI00129DEF3B|nr:protochlorophyllide-dependent translocon component 52, chloroplastic isoform X2 [Nymphaea colorata]